MEEKFYSQLRDALKNSDTPQAEIARQTGVQQASISRFINEKQGLGAENVIRLTNFLGGQIYFPKKSDSAVIRRLAPNAPAESVAGEGLQELAVYDAAGAGPAVGLSDIAPLFTIFAPPDYLRQAGFALVADGHSMEPLIPHRATVGVNTDAPFAANEVYAAHIPYEGFVIKRVAVDMAAKEFVFKSENPNKAAYPDFRLNIAEAEKIIVGRVVWVMWGY